MTAQVAPQVPGLLDRIAGWLLLAITVLVVMGEWEGGRWEGPLSAILAALLILALIPRVKRGRLIFVAVGVTLGAVTLGLRADGPAQVMAALERAAFIGAFFAALTTLRHVAETSPAIRDCGRFLAAQPPGKRYLALTLGGQLFGLLLNYGAIALLGSLATASARDEPNAEIRGHRIRRMLLAVQRGLVSTFAWSPLGFSIAISTSLIPGASWAGAALPALGTAFILAALGWALDTAFKPRLSAPAPARTRPQGTWGRSLAPLLFLLALLMGSVALLHIVIGVPAVGVVMLVVPVISAVWLGLQHRGPGGAAQALARARDYVIRDLPAYRGEVVLLMMAGIIGTLGALLLLPLADRAGIDLSVLPGWVILVAIVWYIPLVGQIGMNPILSVSLMAPLLPTAGALGLAPDDLVVAITAGWALGGASSPFTATTLMVGALGGVSAAHVGFRWNGVYTLSGAVILSGWVVLVAAL
ncbi:hypothetical protein HMH01_10825 [Halovulum dunhuangense]|uniref:H+/citrate symporter n=1 Tax=Halovulum dunhuangense TaxID=1505036 RepID=A0A849L3Y5_9RHOB|nr:hypothetical protein [Halovulum dunhuangense]NNU80930.1 hypothetical protein [Halovulum dunhuangense]